MPKGFFNVQNLGDVAQIQINGIIGDWGNSSIDVIEQIENIGNDEIEILIQSPGGSAFEGIAIHNVLVAHKAKVTTKIIGAAASAASVIFMAGDERIMPKNTHLMIHEPSVVIQGRARDLREAADFLDSITQSLLATYGPRVNMAESDLLGMITAETWMTANEAYNHGFATQTIAANKAVALSNDFLNRFHNLPSSVTALSLDDIQSIKDFERYLRESGGYSRTTATAIVATARNLLQSDSAQMSAIANVLNKFKLGANHAI